MEVKIVVIFLQFVSVSCTTLNIVHCTIETSFAEIQNINSTVSSANCRYVAGNYYSQFGVRHAVIV